MADDPTPNIFQNAPEGSEPIKSDENVKPVEINDLSSQVISSNEKAKTDESKVEIEIDDTLTAETENKNNESAKIETQSEVAEPEPIKKEQNLSSAQTLLSILSYLNILVFITLINKPKDEYTKFHLRQGLFLTAVDLIWIIFVSILAGFVGRLLGDLIFLFFFLFPFLGVHGFLAFKAFQGEKFEILGLSKEIQKINLDKLDLNQFTYPQTTKTEPPQAQTSQNNDDGKASNS